MLRTKDIRSLSEFRQDASAHLDRLIETGGVEVLTVNGQAKGVVMSPDTYDRLAECAFQAEIAAKIRQGMADVEAGRVRDAGEALRSIADHHALKLEP
jgi:PHD/YefM family antitoxin component YafN of YafNO toxin-antitoxin module